MNPVLQTILISLIVGVMLAAVGFAFGRLGRSRDRKSDKVLHDEKDAIEAVKVRDGRIAELERSVELLEARAEARDKAAIPIEAAMQAMLIAKLTNDHTPAADALLKKVTDGTLTPDDAIKFAEAMKNRETDDDERIGEAQQLAAKILPDMIRLKELAEQERASGDCKTKTMMVTVPETETKASLDGGTQEKEKGN